MLAQAFSRIMSSKSEGRRRLKAEIYRVEAVVTDVLQSKAVEVLVVGLLKLHGAIHAALQKAFGA